MVATPKPPMIHSRLPTQTTTPKGKFVTDDALGELIKGFRQLKVEMSAFKKN